MKNITSVLFDLDGTLLDTAPDLAYALNQQRKQHDLPELPLSAIRPCVSYGSKSLLKLGFNVDDTHPEYKQLLEEFFMFYQTHLANSTQLFPSMDTVLAHLEAQQIPWGIVTNKPARFTSDILKKLHLLDRAACVISGDSLARRKPDPDPILHVLQINTA